MTKRMSRTGLFAGVLALIMVCAAVIAVQPAYADGPNGVIKFGKKMTVSKAVYCADIDMGTKLKGAQKVTLKSSNKKVFKPDGYYKEAKLLMGEPNKKGTATLTVKVKKKSGTKTYTGKLKVVSYKNPVKKFTLGGKDITKKFKSGTYYDYKMTSKKAKINIKPKKGWKVQEITYGYWNYSTDKWVDKKVKNGSTINFRGDGGQIYVMLYKKSANQMEELIISPVSDDYE